MEKPKIEVHHVLPLSLGWMDITENRIPLQRHVHSHIHAVLNIPHRKVRDLRTLQNGLDTPYEAVARREAELLRSYMGNLDKLPQELREAHINSLIWQIQRLKYEIKARTLCLIDKKG